MLSTSDQGFSNGGKERESGGGPRGIFPELFFTALVLNFLSFPPSSQISFPFHPCLETFNPLAFYPGERNSTIFLPDISFEEISLSLSPCLSFYVIENFPRYTRRCFQICLVEQEGKHRDIPGSHSEARAPISLTGLILRVYFPRSR